MQGAVARGAGKRGGSPGPPARRSEGEAAAVGGGPRGGTRRARRGERTRASPQRREARTAPQGRAERAEGEPADDRRGQRGAARTRVTGERRRRQAEANGGGGAAGEARHGPPGRGAGRSPERGTATVAGPRGGADRREHTAKAPRGAPAVGASTGQAAGCPPDRPQAGRGEGPHRQEITSEKPAQRGPRLCPF